MSLLTLAQIKKIECYLGLEEEVLTQIAEWIDLNPLEAFDADEFIEWMESQRSLNIGTL